ncbi:MAG: biopolymer transporter ExbD [Bacteroidales bacterium]|nr:biopolymer transporter ExbD [Bacteroidales bacterium]
MAKRGIPEINAGSMADISFLLLIFFLVATSMDIDSGLMRKLPPWVENLDVKPPEVKRRNVFTVLINANNDLLIQGEWGNIKDLRKKVKEFIENPNDDPNMPEKEIKNIPYFGNYPVSKQVISVQNDRGTKYEIYLKVQNEIVAAYNELREELAQKKFGKSYNKLDEDKREAINLIYPQRISEAEPKNIGGRK